VPDKRKLLRINTKMMMRMTVIATWMIIQRESTRWQMTSMPITLRRKSMQLRKTEKLTKRKKERRH